jgi:predicted transcriptional regulator
MRIEIVEDLERRMDADNEYVKGVIEGKVKHDPKRAEHTLLLTPETFSQIFTPERIRLILRVRRNKINNIYQLAKELGRRYEAVHRDIKYLEGYGIIKIRKEDTTRIPYINEKINMPIFGAA